MPQNQQYANLNNQDIFTNVNEQSNLQLNPYENLKYNEINSPFLINPSTNSILLNMNNKGILNYQID